MAKSIWLVEMKEKGKDWTTPFPVCGSEQDALNYLEIQKGTTHPGSYWNQCCEYRVAEYVRKEIPP